jgi:hypothetical protein
MARLILLIKELKAKKLRNKVLSNKKKITVITEKNNTKLKKKCKDLTKIGK